MNYLFAYIEDGKVFDYDEEQCRPIGEPVGTCHYLPKVKHLRAVIGNRVWMSFEPYTSDKGIVLFSETSMRPDRLPEKGHHQP